MLLLLSLMMLMVLLLVRLLRRRMVQVLLLLLLVKVQQWGARSHINVGREPLGGRGRGGGGRRMLGLAQRRQLLLERLYCCWSVLYFRCSTRSWRRCNNGRSCYSSWALLLALPQGRRWVALHCNPVMHTLLLVGLLLFLLLVGLVQLLLVRLLLAQLLLVQLLVLLVLLLLLVLPCGRPVRWNAWGRTLLLGGGGAAEPGRAWLHTLDRQRAVASSYPTPTATVPHSCCRCLLVPRRRLLLLLLCHLLPLVQQQLPFLQLVLGSLLQCMQCMGRSS